MEVNPAEVDSMLARELTQMSMVTRSNIQEEIHGVHSLATKETPELIYRSLQQLQHEIDSITGTSKTVYEDAMIAGNCSYACSDEFRLKFLRADFFDPKKAAVRYLAHLENLWQWWGPISLQRPLQFSDLDREQVEVVRSGCVQILPSRDRAGRLVQVVIIDESWFRHTMETRVSERMDKHDKCVRGLGNCSSFSQPFLC